MIFSKKVRFILLNLSITGALVMAFAAGPANAAVTIDVTQLGGNVVFTADGSLNLTGATVVNSFTTYTPGFIPGGDNWYVAPGPGGTYTSYDLTSSAGQFGTSLSFFTPPSSSSGDDFFIWGAAGGTPQVGVPVGYISGSPIASGMVFDGATIASFDMTPGTFTYTIPDDTIILNIGAVMGGGGEVYFNSASLGATGLSWSSSANWLANGAPTTPQAGDDVFLTNSSGANAAAPTVVNYDATSNPSLNSLTIDGNSSTDQLVTLSQSANALTSGAETIGTTGPAEHLQSGGSNTVTGILTINQFGTYSLQGGTVTASEVIVNSGGTLTATGPTATVTGGATGITVNGGALNNQSGATITISSIGSSLMIGNGGILTNESGSTLNNGPSTNFTNLGGTVTNMGANTTLNNSASLTNTNPGSNFNNQSGATIFNAGLNAVLSNVASAAFTNDGIGTSLYNANGATLNNEGGFTYFYNQNNAFFYNATVGTSLNNTTGALFFNQTGAQFINEAATLTNSSGATFTNTDVGTQFYNNETASFTNTDAGTQLVNQNQATFTNSDGGTTFINKNGATFTNTDSGTFLNQNRATFTNTDAGTTLINQNEATFTNTDAGTTLINQNGATITETGLSIFTNEFGATLTNTGAGTQLNNQDSGDLTNGGSGAMLNNQNGATLTNTGSFTTLLNLDGATLTNADPGTLLINQNGATLTNSDADTQLINGNGATLTNTGAGTTLTNTAGAFFTNSNSAIFNNTNSAVFNNEATFENFLGGVLQNDATVLNSGSFSVYVNSTLQGAGTYTQTGGSTSVAGSFTQSALFIQGGSFTDIGTSTTNLTGTLTVGGPSGTYDLQSGTFNASTITVNPGGSFFFDGGTANFTTLNLNDGGTVATGNAIEPGSGKGDELIEGTSGGTITLEYSDCENGTVCTPTLSRVAVNGFTNVAQSGASSTNTAGAITIGQHAGTVGIYDLQGGTVTAAEESIGGGSGGGTGYFFQVGGSNTTGSLNVNSGTSIGLSAGYYLASGDLSVQEESVSAGRFSQSGGTNNVGGTLSVTPDYSGVPPEYQLSGGTLTAGQEFIGFPIVCTGSSCTTEIDYTHANPIFTQSGGTNTISASLTINNLGTYNLEGGALTAATIQVNDEGQFNQTGGAVNAVNFNLAGTATAIDENIGTTADSSSSLGFDGIETFTQSGTSTNTLTGTLTVEGPKSTYDLQPTYGTYDLQSGTLNAPTITVNSGGKFLFDGGTANFTTFNLNDGGTVAAGFELIEGTSGGTITLEYSDCENGTVCTPTLVGVAVNGFTNVAQSGASSSNTAGVLTIGQHAGTFGIYALQGGTLTATNVSEYIGGGSGGGTGYFFQTGGSNTTGNLYVDSGTSIGLSAGYYLAAGDLSTFEEYVGAGLFSQSGGTNNVGDTLYVRPDYSGVRPEYQLSGGTLTARQEFVGFPLVCNLGGTCETKIDYNNASPIFTQSSGTNTVSESLTINNLGTYNLEGGTLTAATIHVNEEGQFNQTGGAVNVSGNVTNAGNVTIDGTGVTMTVGGSFTQSAGSTILHGGTLNASGGVVANGGTFGGTGTINGMTGGVTVNNATLQVGASPDPLHIIGNFTQTGGDITFEVDPNGSGGFLESTLVLDKGAALSISDTQIIFDFLNGADPTTFFNDGLFNLDTFFNVSNGDPFSADFSLSTDFSNDVFFDETGNGPFADLALDAGTGDLTPTGAGPSAVPESPSALLLLPGLCILGAVLYRRRRSRSGNWHSQAA